MKKIKITIYSYKIMISYDNTQISYIITQISKNSNLQLFIKLEITAGLTSIRP